MAIQMRRGRYEDFNPQSLLAGEWAIVLQGDTGDTAAQGKGVYIAFSAGDVRRLMTEQELANAIIRANTQIVEQLQRENTEQNAQFNAAETIRGANENQRIENERTRGVNETTRREAEEARVNSESSRVDVEAQRVLAEQARAEAENIRVQNENERKSNESLREKAESTRISNETSRQLEELDRGQAESVRSNGELERSTAETARIQNEKSRVSAESERVKAESERITAEALRNTQQEKNNADQALNNQSARQGQPHYLTRGEFDPVELKPIISDPIDGVLYLVPFSDTGSDDNYIEWLYRRDTDTWERIGAAAKPATPIPTDKIDNITSGTSQTGDELLNTTGLSYVWSKIKSVTDACMNKALEAFDSAVSASTMTQKLSDKVNENQEAIIGNNNSIQSLSVKVDKKANNEVFEGCTPIANGTQGLVPAPSAGSVTRMLASDGTWKEPPNPKFATTSTAGTVKPSTGLNIVSSTGELLVDKQFLLDTLYPVGTIYQTAIYSFNPATAFGGTWTVRRELGYNEWKRTA